MNRFATAVSMGFLAALAGCATMPAGPAPPAPLTAARVAWADAAKTQLAVELTHETNNAWVASVDLIAGDGPAVSAWLVRNWAHDRFERQRSSAGGVGGMTVGGGRVIGPPPSGGAAARTRTVARTLALLALPDPLAAADEPAAWRLRITFNGTAAKPVELPVWPQP